MSINRVFVSGNLTRDADVKLTQSGFAIVSFGVAVNDRKKNPQTGEWEDYANFVDCTMFGTRAEKIQPYLEKGVKVSVEGKLRWSQWEKDGQKRSKLEVIVGEIEFMSRGASRATESQQDDKAYGGQRESVPDSFSQAQARAYNAVVAGVNGQVIDTAPSVYDEDIPF